MRKITQYMLVAAVAVLGGAAGASANDDQECSLTTLRGVYVFAATGDNVVAGVPQPKAIIEVIEFNGDGTLLVPAATRSVNGAVGRSAGVTGGYTVDAGCTGTISFDGPGPKFDVFLSPRGDRGWMIQTDPNTVFQGTVTRVSRDRPGDSDRH